MALVEVDFENVPKDKVESALHQMLDNGMAKQVAALLLRDMDGHPYERIARDMSLPLHMPEELVAEGRQVLYGIIFSK